MYYLDGSTPPVHHHITQLSLQNLCSEPNTEPNTEPNIQDLQSRFTQRRRKPYQARVALRDASWRIVPLINDDST